MASGYRFDFAGRGVLVTGALGGIGAAAARRFAEAGASVAVHGRDEARGRPLMEELRAAGARAAFVAGDLADPDACARIVEEAKRALGRLDVLVNNAATLKRTGVLEATDDQWLDVMAINVDAAFFVARAAARILEPGGAIVNISSEMGRFGNPRSIPYCVSKAALIQMTRAMALDLVPRRIRVNCVAPGGTRTAMLDQTLRQIAPTLEEGLKIYSHRVPMRRFAKMDEVVPAVLFAASDLASYITGAVISVDGGTTICGPGGRIEAWEPAAALTAGARPASAR